MRIPRLLFHAAGIVCTSVAFFDLIGCPMEISGTSMLSTLNPGDVVWVSKFFLQPRRDDICVFTPPSDPARNHIKRISTLEGDLVVNKQGVNLMVPKNHLWMLSDNYSCPIVFDSRAYGVVNQGLVKGIATHVIWPPNRWSKLRNFDKKMEE